MTTSVRRARGQAEVFERVGGQKRGLWLMNPTLRHQTMPLTSPPSVCPLFPCSWARRARWWQPATCICQLFVHAWMHWSTASFGSLIRVQQLRFHDGLGPEESLVGTVNLRGYCANQTSTETLTIVKNAHYNFLEPVVMSLNILFGQSTDKNP